MVGCVGRKGSKIRQDNPKLPNRMKGSIERNRASPPKIPDLQRAISISRLSRGYQKSTPMVIFVPPPNTRLYPSNMWFPRSTDPAISNLKRYLLAAALLVDLHLSYNNKDFFKNWKR